jgi:hypothetical protein
MDPFIQWLLAITYKLEVWVMQFLNTPAMGLIERPFLASIARIYKTEINLKEHTVYSIPIFCVTQAPSQEDSCNCGIYALLNTRAAYLADLHHHVNWNKVHNESLLWSLVLKPFWELPKKS